MTNCLMCGRYLKEAFSFTWFFSFEKLEKKYVCQACLAKFLKIKTSCLGCGRKQRQATLCQDCMRWQKMGVTLIQNKALYVYNEAMKDYMKRYKFLGDYEWRLILKKEFTQFVLKNYPPKEYLYCPIPIDITTKQTRGFNQVEGLLEDLKLTSLLEFKPVTNRKKQSHKTRKERMQTKQPFVYCGDPNLKVKKIVLLDDIYTTGKTLYHAAEILQQYALKIQACTLAR